MPFVGAGHEVHAVTHVRIEEDHHRFAAAAEGLGVGEGLQDGRHIMAVGDEGVPAKGFPLGLEVALAGHVVDIPVNLLVVPVGHGDQVVQPMMGGEQGRFPDLAFFTFPVAAEDVGEMRVAVQPFSEGDAGRGGETLAEGAGCLGDAREAAPDGRVTLEPGAEFAESGEFFDRDVAHAGEDGVIHRGQVAGGQDEDILILAVPGPGGRIMLHDAAIQGGQEIGARHRAARMPGLGHRDHPDDVPADLCGNLVQFFKGFHMW